MTAQCPSCGAAQPDGLLCYDDAVAVETMLAAVPQLVDELQVAISKQAKLSTGSKAGKGSAHERSPVNWGAVAVRDALLVEYALWGGDINVIRRHPQAAEIASGIGKVVKEAYRCIDRMADRKYLGKCMAQSDGEATCECVCHGHGAYPPPCDVPGGCFASHRKLTCTAEIWVKPGAHQVECSQCGTVHNVSERRADLLQEAKDVICTVKEASSYMGEVGNIRVTEASIRGYLHRGRIAYKTGTMIRLGDLLAVVLDESERKAS